MLVWRSVQAERPPPVPEHQRRLDKWRTLALVMHELRGTLWWLHPIDHVDQRTADSVRASGRVPAIAVDGEADIGDLTRKFKGIQLQVEEEGWDTGAQHDQEQDGDVQVCDGDGGDGRIPYDDTVQRVKALAHELEFAVRCDLNEIGQLRNPASTSAAANRITEETETLHRAVQAGAVAAAAFHRASKVAEWRSWVSENIT